MPSYSSHLIFNFIALSAFLIYLQEHPILTPLMTFFTVIGYFIGTCFLTPDLDTPKSKPAQSCGVICKPYTIMSTHRGMSHHVVWGIVSRIVYAMLVVLAFVGLFGLVTTESAGAMVELIVQYRLELGLIAAGLFFSNLFHILLDEIA